MADKKISQLTTASLPLTGSEELPLVQGGATLKATAQDIANLASSGPIYSYYSAILTSNGASAPTPTVLQNTLPGPIVWTRPYGNGKWIGTLTGVFPANKTWMSLTFGEACGNLVKMDCPYQSVDEIAIFIDDSGGYADPNAGATIFVEVRVYP